MILTAKAGNLARRLVGLNDVVVADASLYPSFSLSYRSSTFSCLCAVRSSAGSTWSCVLSVCRWVSIPRKKVKKRLTNSVSVFDQGLAPSLREIEELAAVAGEYCDISTFAKFCREVRKMQRSSTASGLL